MASETSVGTGTTGATFQKLALATTAATYLLILVGGLVRATGSGLGCPDWPTCFGSWVPPTDAAELPPGFDAALFNPVNTWIEYINRLVGVTIGLLIFATLVVAVRRHRDQPRIVWSSVLAFVLVAFEGWLGAKVVEHELASWIVTVHLVGALVVVSLLLYATFCAFFPAVIPASARSSWRKRTEPLVVGLMGLSLLQAGLGALVRGFIEDKILANPGLPRSEWLLPLTRLDLSHRQLAVLVLFGLAFLAWRAFRRRDEYRWIWRFAFFSFGLAGLQILAGLGLAYAGMPAALQVVHLTLGSLLLGTLTTTWLFVRQVPEGI